MKRRVVVTGLGAVTPIGNTVDVFWDEIKKGTVGIGPITQFDVSDYKVKIAAQVKGFDARERLDFKSAKRMELFTQYAAAAAKEAFEDAGIDMEKEDPYRAGVIVGSGVGSLKCVEDNYETILKKGPNRVHPLMVPLMISNMAAGNISIRLGLRGKCTNVATACASGSHCIGDAFRAIQYGDADIMVAGGAESAISPTGLAGFTALTALSTSEDPTCASRPFDKDRDGFVLGEGAGIIVLEELEHAKARGAKIYAELAGYGATADAWHITSPAEDGEGAAMAMKLAMREAGVRAEQWTNRPARSREGCAFQMDLFADIMKQTVRELEKSIFTDERMEKRIAGALRKCGMRVLYTYLFLNGEGKFEVHVTVRSTGKEKGTAKEVVQAVSEAAGRRFVLAHGSPQVVGFRYMTRSSWILRLMAAVRKAKYGRSKI